MTRAQLFPIALALIAIPRASGTTAQQPSISLAKGQLYTVKIPAAVMNYREFKTGHMGFCCVVSSVLLAEITGAAPSIQIGGDAHWQSSGFPSLLQVKFDKVNAQKDFTDLEFRGARVPSASTDLDVRLRFPRGFDYGGVLGQLVVPGPSSSPSARAYLDERYGVLAESVFAGPLAVVPPEKQRALMVYAHATARGTRLGSETFKNNLFMVVNLGRDPLVFNDLRFSESTRLTQVMNETLFARLKAFAKPVEGVPQIYGLKLEYEIPHKSFLNETDAPTMDVLQFYAPADLIKKFADADITNQQFADGCVVILNTNRVQVSLTGGR